MVQAFSTNKTKKDVILKTRKQLLIASELFPCLPASIGVSLKL